jgi:hypothetical protein
MPRYGNRRSMSRRRSERDVNLVATFSRLRWIVSTFSGRLQKKRVTLWLWPYRVFHTVKWHAMDEIIFDSSVVCLYLINRLLWILNPWEWSFWMSVWKSCPAWLSLELFRNKIVFRNK